MATLGPSFSLIHPPNGQATMKVALEGQHAHAGRHRSVTVDVEQVQGEVEQHPEQGEEDSHHDE